jgi:hypothetical protein
VPRNVVTVVPRRLVLPTRRNRQARETILEELGQRYRLRHRDDGGTAIDFPKRLGRRAARDQVVAELGRIDPRWSRLFVVYPKESSLKE